MAWQAIETIPFQIGVTISAGRAASVRSALLRRAIPLSRFNDGRLEPLATASLVCAGREVGLLTAAHVFDHVSAGDLAVPMPADGDVARLSSIQLRIIADPAKDLALIWIGAGRLSQRLRANWSETAIDRLHEPHRATRIYGIAGYPFAQTVRQDGCVFAKPVVVFTGALDDDCYAYQRTAERLDGIEIHTPALDGVSGAMLWAIDELDPDPAVALSPVAVQIAFRHGRHLRASPLGIVEPLLERALH